MRGINVRRNIFKGMKMSVDKDKLEGEVGFGGVKEIRLFFCSDWDVIGVSIRVV